MSIHLGEPDGPLTPRVEYWRKRAVEAEAIISRLEDPTREVWAACGDAVVNLQQRDIGHHDKITQAVLTAAVNAARKSP